MIKKLMAQILDEAAIMGISALGVVIFDLVIRLFGFKVVKSEFDLVLFISFIIFNILYAPILESTKLKETFGKKIMNMGDHEDKVALVEEGTSETGDMVSETPETVVSKEEAVVLEKVTEENNEVENKNTEE